MVLIVCATALGLYGIYTIDRSIGLATALLTNGTPTWQSLLPPALADALHDRRAFEYRKSLEITPRLVRDADDPTCGELIIDVVNRGEAVVSLLALRTVVEDESGLFKSNVYAATPFSGGTGGDWCGPLAYDPRKVSLKLRNIEGDATVHVEVSDLRIWTGPASPATEPPGASASGATPLLPAPPAPVTAAADQP